MKFESKVSSAVIDSLDKAEKIWEEVGEQFFFNKAFNISEARANSEKPTLIPGFPFVEDGKPKVANYIAMVLDIRGSTKHLTQAISGTKASQLKRVLLETTAINAMGEVVVSNYGGKITEFLGDGFLALFKVETEGKPNQPVYDAHNSAKKSIKYTKSIVNKILLERYALPKLQIGIGLAYSKAIVTLVGYDDNLHPKAIGECVYRSSKLSEDVVDEILIDERLRKLWPSSDNGKLSFSKFVRKRNFDAYKINRTES